MKIRVTLVHEIDVELSDDEAANLKHADVPQVLELLDCNESRVVEVVGVTEVYDGD